MSDFSIRRLGADDVPLLRALSDLFGEVFGEPEAYAGAPPGNAYLARLLGRQDFVALAAMVDGGVVGGLTAYGLEKYEQERREIYIYDLAVAETHRRQGIATALIEALKPIAAAAGGYVIFVQADQGDAAAIALYAKLGTREDVLHFDIPVTLG